MATSMSSEVPGSGVIGRLLRPITTWRPPHPHHVLRGTRKWGDRQTAEANHNMATSRLPPVALTLKQFLRRQQVLSLYRKIFQTIRQIPNEADRRYMKDWAREEFKRNKETTDEVTIRMMLTQGNLQLRELERSLQLAKS
ncbi:LYR motif-containing protein 2 isoform X1 [Ambystoma mexicanum]|uniref:LYR motif-containing protein 2 isoform X1 n=1 Tax=Ambystoma mexicanum TaxID=8296 RepID=UPI0037E94BAB